LAHFLAVDSRLVSQLLDQLSLRRQIGHLLRAVLNQIRLFLFYFQTEIIIKILL
jgi:hypothetical protein